MIEQDKINEIIEKTDIVSLVGQYVQLTKAGSDYDGHHSVFNISLGYKITIN